MLFTRSNLECLLEARMALFDEMVSECPDDTDLWSKYLDQEIRLGDKRMIRALFDRATSFELKPKNMKILFDKYRMYEKSLGDEGRIKRVKVQLRKYILSPLPYITSKRNGPKLWC